MSHNIPVSCLIDRYWNPETRYWDGRLVAGTLIDVSTQSAEDGSGKTITVGVVLIENNISDDDDTFQAIPLEFIWKV